MSEFMPLRPDDIGAELGRGEESVVYELGEAWVLKEPNPARSEAARRTSMGTALADNSVDYC